MTFYSFAIGLVAFLHVVFFFLEAVLWTSPMVTRLFQMSRGEAETTRVLALNQGVYNLGAAVLLVWFAMGDNMVAVMGLLSFISVMGIVGALTANWRIILLQTLPAVVAMIALYHR